MERAKRYKIKEFAEAATRMIVGMGMPPSQSVQVRTIRFYEQKGMIRRVGKDGRESLYDQDCLMRILAIREMQCNNVPLDVIKATISSSKWDAIRESFEKSGLFEAVVPSSSSEKEEDQASMSITQATNSEPKTAGIEEKGQVIFSDSKEYERLKKNMWVGAMFAFVVDAPDDVGMRISKFFNGAKSTGCVKNVVFQMGSDFIGCETSCYSKSEGGCGSETCRVCYPNGKLNGKLKSVPRLSFLLPDKDVYQEGEDVARIFVFHPEEKGKDVNVVVCSGGSAVESAKVRLNQDGCGMLRVPTLVAGDFTASISGTTIETSFSTARYRLAPMTASIRAVKADKTRLHVDVYVESFGVSFEGPIKVELVEAGHKVLSQTEAKVIGGDAQFSLEFGEASESLSLRVTSVANPGVLTSVPLYGSKKSERDDTLVSSLGKLVSVSLMPSDGSIEERGLHISSGGVNNSPVTIDECVVDSYISLKVHEKSSGLLVVFRDAATGEESLVDDYQFSEAIAGSIVRIQCPYTVATMHIGAILGGKPWEGHSLVMLRNSSPVKLKVQDRADPSGDLPIRIFTKKRSSVLLRVRDKRIRGQYEPSTKIASLTKGWLGEFLGSKKTGTVGGQGVGVSLKGATASPYRVGLLADADRTLYQLGPIDEEEVGSRGLGRDVFVNMVQTPALDMMYRAPAQNFDYQAAISQVSDTGPRTSGILRSSMSVAKGQDKSLETIIKEATERPSFSGSFGYSGVSGFSGSSRSKAAEKWPALRASIADVVYCELVEVDGEKEVVVSLPGSVGEFDVSAFAVSGTEWSEANSPVSVRKESYIEAVVPTMAGDGDGVRCFAASVGHKDGDTLQVKVNDKIVAVDDGSGPASGQHLGFSVVATSQAVWRRPTLEWDATPGLHEITLRSSNGDVRDRILRVVQAPGEEIVMTREVMILRKGESYSMGADDGTVSVMVMPGLESDMKAAINVCLDFQHSCCEQTAAKLCAAALAIMRGSDGDKEKGFASIKMGHARMRDMHVAGGGFLSYPGGSMNQTWSLAAGRRLSRLGCILDVSGVPADVSESVKCLLSMGEAAMAKTAGSAGGPFEGMYYEGKCPAESVIPGLISSLGGSGSFIAKSEAMFCAAALARGGKIEGSIQVANAVSKAMGGAIGGGFHGSYECVAYMSMIYELEKAGVAGSGSSGSVEVNGSLVPIGSATGMNDVEDVKATDGVVVLRICRLKKLKFDERAGGVAISLKLSGIQDAAPSAAEGVVLGGSILSGNRVKLIATIDDGYKDGDVLCVALPECLSRMIGSAKAKKFEIDFRGRKQVEVELVAHAPTSKPQRWGAVVRNMYDEARIGCVGILAASVS